MMLSDFAVRKPVVISILLVVLVVFGLLALVSLNREMVPPVGLPVANVITRWPGAGADDVEEAITRRVENQLATLAGLSTMTSTSEDSFSRVEMEFRDGTDVYGRIPEIRELLNEVEPELPDGIDGSPEILVFEANSLIPIFSVQMDSAADPVAFARFLDDELSPRLARIPGVARINIVGDAQEELTVTLDARQARARGVTPAMVLNALQYGNADVPSGSASFRGQTLPLTSQGSFASLDDVGALVLASDGGAFVRLADIAEISVGPAEQSVRVRSGGESSVVVDILKRDEGDTTAIVGEAVSVLDEIATENPNLFSWRIISDHREMTDSAISTVATSALIGTLLATLVVLFFLHDLRATIIVAVSIPLSVLFAFAAMFLSGQSVNLLTMSGVTVAIGMIVDASIVVLENTYRHFRSSGDREDAARRGAGEVGGAILASTLTSVSVFLPLIFLTGIIGIIMQDLSLTIVYALAASALVAVVVVPFLSSTLLRRGRLSGTDAPAGRLGRRIDAGFQRVEAGYRRLLAGALRDGRFVVAVALAILVTSVLLLTVLPVSFLPPTDTGEFEILIETPRSSSLDDTQRIVDEIDRIVAEAVPEQTASVYYVGTGGSLAIIGSSNEAFARIRLVPDRERERSVHEIILAVQAALDREVPNADATVLNGGFDSLLGLATGGQGYQVEIFGPDLEAVVALAEQTREQLAGDPDVRQADTNTALDAEQLRLELDHQELGTLGVASREAGLTARILMNGVDAGSYTGGSDRVPIRLTSRFEDREVGDDLLTDMTLTNANGTVVSFAAFSELSSRQTVSSITKRDRTFSATVRGYLFTEDQAGVTQRTEAMLSQLDLPPGLRWQRAGTSELIVDSMRSLATMLGIAIFLVYVVMVIQFERYGQPLVIMAAVPFCLIGVIAGLSLFGSPLSIIAMLGLITLGGTVVNNAIVLVDYMNTLRRRDGLELEEAILEGATGRLRPVLMTTVTTLLAVMPMAFAVGDGSEIYAPLGQAIFGGLLTSMLITLILVPVLYRRLELRELRRPAATRTRSAATTTVLAVLALGLVPGQGLHAQTPEEALRTETATLGTSFVSRVRFETDFSMERAASLPLDASDGVARAAAAERIAAADLAAARGQRLPRLSAQVDSAWLANPMDAVTIPPGSLGELPVATGTTPPTRQVVLPPQETELLPGGEPFVYELGLSLSQSIWTWGRIDRAVAAARASRRAATTRRLALSHGTRAEAGALAERIAILDAIGAALEVQTRAAERLVRISRENWTNGFVTETVYLDARLSEEDARLARVSIREQRGNAADQLRLLLGLDELPETLIPAEPPQAGRLALDSEETVAAARRGSWELGALEAAENARQAAEDQAAAARVRRPSVGLEAEVGWAGAYSDITADSWDERGSWRASVGVGISGDLFDGGRSEAAFERAGEQRLQASIDRRERVEEIDAALRRRLRRLDTLRARLQHAAVEESVRRREMEDAQSARVAGAGGEQEVLRAIIEHASVVTRGYEYLAEYRGELWAIGAALGAAAPGMAE